ncbi:MAG: DUF397 domain-containing protein [Trebonia sp.]
MDGISADWRKSTFSGANGASCVEVGTASAGVVVRDTTDRAGTVLAVSDGAWRMLLAQVRAS